MKAIQPCPQGSSRVAIADILSGKKKPANETEAIGAMTAMLWKKAYESALSSFNESGSDPLAEPEKNSIKDQQATWMGIQAAETMSLSLTAQLNHMKPSKL